MTTRLDYWDTDSDRQRLLEQARRAGEVTERLLRRAGIRPGMRVLDVGTGMGDVAFIAAELVGPSGYVLGVDQLGASIEGARARGLEAGLGHVEFEVADFHDLAPAELFDAAVGRYVLQHQSDPVASLRCVASYVRPSGVLAFLEASPDHDSGRSGQWWPASAAYDTVQSFIVSTMAARGMQSQMGHRLFACMLEAGLEPSPDIEGSFVVRVGLSDPAFLAYVRGLVPDAQRLGIHVPDDALADDLPERVAAEVAPAPFVHAGVPMLSVWARKP